MGRAMTDRRAGLFGVVLLAGGLWVMSLAGCAGTDGAGGKVKPESGPDVSAAPLARAVPISSITVMDGDKTFVLVGIEPAADGREEFVATEHPTTQGKVTVHPQAVRVTRGATGYTFEVRGVPGQQGEVKLELYEKSRPNRKREHRMQVPRSGSTTAPAPVPAADAANRGKAGVPEVRPMARAVPISSIEPITPTNSADPGAYAPGTLLEFKAVIDANEKFESGAHFVVAFTELNGAAVSDFLTFHHGCVNVHDPAAKFAQFWLQLSPTAKAGRFTVAAVDYEGSTMAEKDVMVGRPPAPPIPETPAGR